MKVNLWQYYLLTFISFSFFFCVFHTVAEAQTPSTPATPSISTPAYSDSSVLFHPTPLPTTTIPATLSPTPTMIPTPIPTFIPHLVTSAELETLFTQFGTEYHVDSNWLKKIARCESNFNPQADTGTYAGMFQFSAGTWISTRNNMGLDPNPDLRKNAEESIRTTAFMLSKGRQNAWPNCK